jgi:peptidase E
MTKPEIKNKSYFDYFEIKDYIIEKYNCEEDEDKCWDYMCDTLEVRNDSYSYIPTDSNKLKYNKFIQAVKEEFGENLEVWITW